MKAGAGDVMLDEDDHDTLAPFLVGFAFPNVHVIKHLYVTKINIHSVVLRQHVVVVCIDR